MIRIQLRIISGISSPVASRYSSNEPPNNLGCPVIFMRPIRFLFGTMALTNRVLLLCSTESFAKAARSNSAFESSRAIRDVPKIYSRIFCNIKKRLLNAEIMKKMYKRTNRNVKLFNLLFVGFKFNR